MRATRKLLVEIVADKGHHSKIAFDDIRLHLKLQVNEELSTGVVEDFVGNMSNKQTASSPTNNESTEGQVRPSSREPNNAEKVMTLTTTNGQSQCVIVKDEPSATVAGRKEIRIIANTMESCENIDGLVLESQKQLDFEFQRD